MDFFEKKFEGIQYAVNGLRIAWQEESNFRFKIGWTVLILLIAFVLKLPKIEFIFIFFLAGFVLVAELLNTALEEWCDKFQPTHDTKVATIKDISAGAVLISTLTTLIISAIIFFPYL